MDVILAMKTPKQLAGLQSPADFLSLSLTSNPNSGRKTAHKQRQATFDG